MTTVQSKTLDKLFGETIENGADKIYLPILFTIILCTTTLFFYNHKTINLNEINIHFSLGLIVFPLTFTIINIIQDKYGRLFANTVVRYAFIADLFLVFLGYTLSIIGERVDYRSVYDEIPIIMLSTFFFVWMSNFINTSVFSFLKKRKLHDFFKYSIAAILAESSVSMISIPMLISQNNLTGSVLFSLIVVVLYKIAFTVISAVIISVRNHLRNLHQE